MQDAFKAIQGSLASGLRGKESIIELSVGAFLAGGHLLLEGPPGSGKTSLARGLARAFGGSFRRIQMTSDLLPSDIIGFLRIKPGMPEFEFRPGPVFSNFVLADELNRSSPRTQSALLEAMSEATVSVDGVTHPLPDPFFVVATQNPMEFQGVYPLAESQLDRFMLLLPFGFPEREDELKVYGSETEGGAESTPAILQGEELRRVRAEIRLLAVERTVLEYALELVRETRSAPEVTCGVSVRGGLQLLAMARSLAWLRGRTFVIPKDVQDAAIPVLAHRISFSDGHRETERKRRVVREILDRVRVPR